MSEKEIDQNVTQLTDEEMGAVNGGNGSFSINEALGDTGFFFSTSEIDSDGNVLINGEKTGGSVVKPTEYVRCCKCRAIIAERKPGDPKTSICFRCKNRIAERVKNSTRSHN